MSPVIACRHGLSRASASEAGVTLLELLVAAALIGIALIPLL